MQVNDRISISGRDRKGGWPLLSIHTLLISVSYPELLKCSEAYYWLVERNSQTCLHKQHVSNCNNKNISFE